MSLEDCNFSKAQIDEIRVMLTETPAERKQREAFTLERMRTPKHTVREVITLLFEKFPTWRNIQLLKYKDYKLAYAECCKLLSRKIQSEGNLHALPDNIKFVPITPDLYITKKEAIDWFKNPANVEKLSWADKDVIIQALGLSS
jgi:hypothetical protein